MRYPQRQIVILFAFIVTASGFLFLSCARCAADVVHLRTGETVKGRPLREASNEEILVIEDYLSGAVRTLSWKVVDAKDRDRIHSDWGWKNKALAAVAGHRLVQELQGGTTQVIRGKIVREDAEYYHILRGGDEIKVRKDAIVEKTEEEMDPRDIWSPEQLVTRFIEGLEKELEQDPNLDMSDSRAKFRVAKYAENAGDFATAQKYYEACANDAEFLNAGVAKQRLAAVEAILRDAEALMTIRTLRMQLSIRSFAKVREGIDAFPRKHAEAGEQIQRRLEKLKKDFSRRRAEYFQLEAKINFPKIVLKQIKVKVQEKDIGLADATAWTRRELIDGSFEQLAARFVKKDPVIKPEDVRAFWENRKKSSWRTAAYGSGTFIREPPKVKPPKRSSRKKKKKRSTGGSGPTFTIPKPPTRDQWWKKSDPKTRQQWLMAFFVEESGLFEVSEKPKYTNCPHCNGMGLESKSLQTGETVRFLCRRCGGAQRDKRVRYR